MKHVALLVIAALQVGGCASSPPQERVVVNDDWREIRYEKLSWKGHTSITVNRWPGIGSGSASFEIREGAKVIGDSEVLTPEQMASLYAVLPTGSTLVGADGLVADATSFNVTVDGQSASVNQSSADAQMTRVIGWFDAYAQTRRRSATTRPWFD